MPVAADIEPQCTEVRRDPLSPALAEAVCDFAARFSLTTRETEVVGLLVAGLGNVPVLARHLQLSRNTVHNHFKNVFRRTQTNSKTGVLALFIQHVSEAETKPAIRPVRVCDQS